MNFVSCNHRAIVFAHLRFGPQIVYLVTPLIGSGTWLSSEKAAEKIADVYCSIDVERFAIVDCFTFGIICFSLYCADGLVKSH